MSKYIPGNQKHLTLNDRIYIENELSKGATFKDIGHSFVKILQLSQKRLNHDAFLTGTTKELSTMPKTFVYTAITVKKQMPVEKSCSAVLNVHPVQPATKPVRISKRNGAADLIRRLMYVMAVQ
ncbi:hypothetical protein LI016_08035 [[Eubacterium] rectale]|uniref:Transposase IS30-like HTH domain-containing protein n=1 Tax=Agathobacter rectalis TaxID=39491 RepID=A0AAW4UA27_9FIRM|nr:hypothetical protein [Agathobacter rectalis]MCB5930399.1 hypothetical protein [Agathobacter rectalis]MCB6937144.1 hypothetical protein [Agathobacter rectalis]MCB6968902.1 hypothetical protein [Agathobacter rectalis]MCQ4889388.1 hypothetical protein [Agathobacter rectalis]MCQ4929380.1 hypothetical protein [Agathobacter rectalis]